MCIHCNPPNATHMLRMVTAATPVCSTKSTYKPVIQTLHHPLNTPQGSSQPLRIGGRRRLHKKTQATATVLLLLQRTSQVASKLQ